MEYNNITELIAHAFVGAVNVKSITLYANRIKTIHPMAFENNEKLIILNLEYNLIKSFDFLMIITKLHTLMISGNNVEDRITDDILIKMGNYSVLSLFNTNLMKIDFDAVAEPSQLLWINLNKNSLIELPISSLKSKFPLLGHLTITDNPWNCTHLIDILLSDRRILYERSSNTVENIGLNVNGIRCLIGNQEKTKNPKGNLATKKQNHPQQKNHTKSWQNIISKLKSSKVTPVIYINNLFYKASVMSTKNYESSEENGEKDEKRQRRIN